MAVQLNSLERDTIERRMAQLQERVAKLQAILSGVPITGVRIRDASITNAKIESVSADKIDTGTLAVGVAIYVGDNIIIGTP